IITTCDLASGAVISLLALGFVAGPSPWRPAMLFAAALLVGVSSAFFEPALNTFVPDLVARDQLEAANAVRQSARPGRVPGAPRVGGILYALVGPAMLFLFDGVSFLFAGATESLIRVERRSTEAFRSIPQNGARGFSRAAVADGFGYINAQPGMM